MVRRWSLLDSSSFRQRGSVVMTKRRNVIVHIATSADGYIARPDGDLEWLTSRPAPKGFYGMNAFMRSIDTKLLGRKTYEVSLRMGAKFDSKSRTIVFSRNAPPFFRRILRARSSFARCLAKHLRAFISCPSSLSTAPLLDS